MNSTTYRRFRLAWPAAALMLAALAPTAARADFFDNARQTFTVDIPHFFQDDVPCFFGGQPTSGARKSCKPPAHAAQPAAVAPTPAPPPTSNATPAAPPNSAH
ncbi:MAG: hypothetical protein KGJ66_14465 [Alphaproteobacteria bacterium]|nr:hypothetical protein [Alphaproteobacteria bacterium]